MLAFIITDLGCPYLLKDTNKYKPLIDLYDYDDLIEVVEADYVVWEINGRVDYTYSHTMEDVGCMSEGQTWEELRYAPSAVLVCSSLGNTGY